MHIEVSISWGFLISPLGLVIAGVTARAPLWAQNAGLEWLFRLLQEPRRLGRRYVASNVQFLFFVAGEVVRRRIMRRPR
jgi:UDP-N-acetyl-D-mannosaminuronic acid transferase (WecB/TagA/CpsF family)